ncbi:unnamed protein product [Sphagnum balticum]
MRSGLAACHRFEFVLPLCFLSNSVLFFFSPIAAAPVWPALFSIASATVALVWSLAYCSSSSSSRRSTAADPPPCAS